LTYITASNNALAETSNRNTIMYKALILTAVFSLGSALAQDANKQKPADGNCPAEQGKGHRGGKGGNGGKGAQQGPQGARMRQMLKERFDANKDGKLDESEKAAAKQQMEKRRAEFVAKWDKDGDGKLSDQEKEAVKAERQKNMLEKFDKNGNGQIDEGERPQRKGAQGKGQQHRRPLPPELRDQLDSDKDGKVSPEERKAGREKVQEFFKAKRAEVLEKYDSNKDGKLDEQEREKLKSERQNRQGGDKADAPADEQDLNEAAMDPNR